MNSELGHQDLAQAVSQERLMHHTREISQWIRLSGSPDEARSFEYIEGALRGMGLSPRVFSHEAYISLPGAAALHLRSDGADDVAIECITHSFGASTSHLEAQVVDVGAGREEDFEAAGVRGKIALCDGLAIPERAMRAQHHGAAALINVNAAEFHEMIISPVWGSPDHISRHHLPNLPVLSVRSTGGERIRDALTRGAATLRLSAEVLTEWRPTPMIEVDIHPTNSPDDTFVLFGGHVDSWHYGAMDNGTANACQLEMAQLFAENRQRLRRSLRIVFWSGHSHGRYSGSQWYVDTHYRELRDRCAAYLFVDSLGGRGMRLLTEAPVMAELRAVAAEVVASVSGQKLVGRRIRRAGDQSFWGIGLPAAYIFVSRVPSEDNPLIAAAVAEMAGRAATPAGTMAPWWHTVHDTIDKIDPGLLVRDTQVYAGTLERILCDPILPFAYGEVADEFRSAVSKADPEGISRLDVKRVLDAIQALTSTVRRFDQEVANIEDSNAAAVNVANRTMMRIARTLIPVNYTQAGPFQHDPALVTPPFPLLEPLRALASLDPTSDDARFTRVAAQRGLNAVEIAAAQATLELEQGLVELHRALQS